MTPMTTKELSQLQHLNREVFHLKKRIEELHTDAQKAVGCITGLPIGMDTSEIAARYTKQITELKRQMEHNLEQCMAELTRLSGYIDSVDDSQLRQILRLRYIYGHSWQKIAFAIGEYDEQVPRKKHDKLVGRG